MLFVDLFWERVEYASLVVFCYLHFNDKRERMGVFTKIDGLVNNKYWKRQSFDIYLIRLSMPDIFFVGPCDVFFSNPSKWSYHFWIRNPRWIRAHSKKVDWWKWGENIIIFSCKNKCNWFIALIKFQKKTNISKKLKNEN